MPNLNKLGLVLLSMERWAAAKELSVSVVVPPAPVRVSSQRPLAPSVASVMSVANDKGVNEMILGAVHRSPAIVVTCLDSIQCCNIEVAFTVSVAHHKFRTTC